MAVEMIGCSEPYREAVGARLAERGLADDESVRIALVTVAADRDRSALEERIADPDLVVVAVVDQLTVDAYVDALAAGADGVVFFDTPSAITADVVEAAVQGEVVLPAQAAQNMARLARRLRPRTDLDGAERALLLDVAAGRTVVQLAADRFYSERTVRRHLQSLYLKLGVQNRAEAIAAATRMGLLD